MKIGIAERLDTWLGKTLFIPIIIRLCQRLGCTQNRFHWVGWFIAFLVGFGFSHSLAREIFFGVSAVVMCVFAGVSGEYPAQSWRWFRLLVFGLLFYELLSGAIGVFHADRPLFDVIALFAEYAALIRTIPPLEPKARKLTLAKARASL